MARRKQFPNCQEIRTAMREDDDDRPRRRPRRDEEDDEDQGRRRGPRRQSSGVSVGWLLGGIFGGAALLVLLCGGVWALLYFRIKSEATSLFVQPGNPPPAGPQNPPQNAGPGANPAPPAPVWDVKADPSPRPPVKVANADRRLALGGDFPYITAVTSTPSPFLSSGLNDFPKHKREVWNLETMEKTAEISGLQMTGPGVLGPDGAYIAGRLNEAGVPFVVISCKDRAKAFELPPPAVAGFDFLEFAGSRRLIIGSDEGPRIGPGRTYRLYDVPGGRQLRQFVVEGKHDGKCEAVSAGGKYLALKSGADVLLYDLDEGRQAGKFAIPGNSEGVEHPELAFSADGKELAVLLESRSRLRILTWNLETNRLGVDHTLSPAVLRSFKTGIKYWGRHLEWLEDGSGWLVRGEVLIDKPTGAPVWRMDVSGTDTDYIRHVVGSTHVARLYGAFAKDGLGLVEIRRGQGDVVKNDPGPVKPPDPNPPKPGEPRHVTLAADATPQPADIDPLPAARRPLRDSVALAAKADDIRAVLFSNPDVAQAAVLTFTNTNDAAPPRPVAVERYDLLRGRSLGKFDLWRTSIFSLTRADLSPDGTLLALNDMATPRHLTAWSLADGKRVADWEPYAQNPGNFSHVRALAVVDARHIITVNLPGDVVLWQLPECKPMLSCNCFALNDLVLSPGRKYVVLRGDKGLVLCNLKTGEARGRFPFPAGEKVLEVVSGSFRPDAKEFAAVLSFGTGRGPTPHRLVRWDCTTGKLIDSYPIGSVPRSLGWCEGGLLIGGSLLDLKLGVPVCTYEPQNGAPAQGSPDGRFWFTHAAKGTEPARLSARLLPDETAKQAAAQVAEGKVKLVLKPGTKVSLQLDFTGPEGDGEYRKRYEEQMGHYLNELGLVVAAGQPIKLRLSAEESDTGKKVRAVVTIKGGTKPGKSEPRDVPLKRITCKAALTDGEGKDLMPPSSQVFEFPDQEVTTETREDPAALVSREQSKRLWDSFANWSRLVALPTATARQGDAVVPWPKTVVLGQGR
jgi:hypothetical protein